MTDETTIQLNGLIKKYGLYYIHLSVSKKVAIYGPRNYNSEVIYIEYSRLIKPDWQSIEKTLVEYTLLHGF